MQFMRLQSFARRQLEVPDPTLPHVRYRFPVHNARMRKRAARLAGKEPGTIRWLDEQVRRSDVVWDVGANIGVYSLFAAARAPVGRVIAFEPHGPTFHALLEVIALNGLADRILPTAVALDARDGFDRFIYADLDSASTGSQLAASPASGPLLASPRAGVTELKYTASADALVAAGVLPAPDLVKIDVDGNETRIVTGMRELLTGPRRPRSLQIESDPDQQEALESLLTGWGYEERARHLSSNLQTWVDGGGDAGVCAINVIWAPVREDGNGSAAAV